MAWFAPSRAMRRRHSGQRCPGCSLPLHHTELVGWASDSQTIIMHNACAELMFDQDVISEESSPAAE